MWNTFKDFVKGLFNSRIAIVVIVGNIRSSSIYILFVIPIINPITAYMKIFTPIIELNIISTNNPDITPVNKPQYCPYIVPAIAVSITSILGETPAIRKCLNNVVCSINPTIIITNILT